MRSLLSVLMLTFLLAAVVAADVKDGEDVGDGETLGGGESMAEVDDGEVGSSQGDGDEKKDKRKSRTQHLSKEVKELRKQVRCRRITGDVGGTFFLLLYPGRGHAQGDPEPEPRHL